jgi:protocatechuate 3,4-dioxygenase beta subunit
MTTKRKSAPSLIIPTKPILTRRKALAGLGAIAATATATACGSSGAASPGAGGGSSSGGAAGGSSSGGSSGGPSGSSGGGLEGSGVDAASSTPGADAASGAESSVAEAGEAAETGVSVADAGGMLVSPPWDNVPMCVASNTDAAGQGPFFIHEGEGSGGTSLVRQDIRGRYNMSADPGVEMHLFLRVLDSTSTSCNQTPVSDIDVYIWHTDGQGFYSGFGTRGGADEQKPDTPYAGVPNTNQLENTDRFLRGVQTTDANGVVAFQSIFPGWYNGRALHIHFVAFKKGSMSEGRVAYTKANSGGYWLFTTQFYFDTSFIKSIHEKNTPYMARTSLSAYPNAIAENEQGNSGLHAKASLSGDVSGVGGIVTAQMQILLNPT